MLATCHIFQDRTCAFRMCLGLLSSQLHPPPGQPPASHRLGGWAKQGDSPCPSAHFCRIVWLGPGHHSLKLSLPHPSPFISLECHPPSTNKPPYSYLLLSAHWPRHPTDKHRLCTFPVLQSGLILIEIAAICGLSKCIHYSELPYTRDLRYLPK